GGTLTVLEAARQQPNPPSVIFTSTSRIYGPLADIRLRLRNRRLEPVSPNIRRHGVAEWREHDFHSPHGCSKGAADKYVSDYARLYAVPTVVLRPSEVYGPRRTADDDQGWVTQFFVQARDKQSVTIYGDGHKVCDLLFVDD